MKFHQEIAEFKEDAPEEPEGEVGPAGPHTGPAVCSSGRSRTVARRRSFPARQQAEAEDAEGVPGRSLAELAGGEEQALEPLPPAGAAGEFARELLAHLFRLAGDGRLARRQPAHRAHDVVAEARLALERRAEAPRLVGEAPHPGEDARGEHHLAAVAQPISNSQSSWLRIRGSKAGTPTRR